jgi:hypothetical protein
LREHLIRQKSGRSGERRGLRRRSVPTLSLLVYVVILRKELHGVAAGRQQFALDGH